MRTTLIAVFALILAAWPAVSNAEPRPPTPAVELDAAIDALLDDPTDPLAAWDALRAVPLAGDLDALIERLEQRAAHRKRRTAGILARATLRRSVGDLDAARRLLGDVVGRAHPPPGAWILQARLALDEGQLSAAWKAYARAVRRAAEPWRKRAWATRWRDAALDEADLDAALAATRAGGRDSSWLARCARAFARRGFDGEAIELWRTALAHARGAAQARVRVELGRALLDAGQVRRAREVLHPAPSLARGDPELEASAWEALVDAWSAGGDVADLLPRLRRQAGRSPRAAEALGRALRAAGDVRGALRALDRALRRFRRSSRLWALRLELARAIGDRGEVVSTLRGWVRVRPDARRGIELVDALLAAGRPRAALTRWRALVRAAWSQPVDLAVVLAAAQRVAASPSEVRRAYERLIVLEPQEPAHLLNLGEYLLARVDPDGALRAWKRLPRVVRPPARGWATLGDILERHGYHHEAVEAYTAALRLDPKHPEWVLARARAERAAGDDDAALLDAMEAATSQAASPATRTAARTLVLTTWKQRGVLGSQRKRFEHLAASGGSEAGSALQWLAWIEADAGNPARALTWLETLAHSNRGDLAAWEALARQAEAVGRSDLRIEAHTKLAALQPRRPEAWRGLYEACRAAGDPRCAQRAARRWLRLAPADARAHLAMARLALDAGDTAEAWRRARRAALLAPSNARAALFLIEAARAAGRASTASTVLAVGRAVARARRASVLAQLAAPFLALCHDSGMWQACEAAVATAWQRRPLRSTAARAMLDLVERRLNEGATWTLSARATRILATLLEGDAASPTVQRVLDVARRLKPRGLVPALWQLVRRSAGAQTADRESAALRAVVVLGLMGAALDARSAASVLNEPDPCMLSALVWAGALAEVPHVTGWVDALSAIQGSDCSIWRTSASAATQKERFALWAIALSSPRVGLDRARMHLGGRLEADQAPSTASIEILGALGTGCCLPPAGPSEAPCDNELLRAAFRRAALHVTEGRSDGREAWHAVLQASALALAVRAQHPRGRCPSEPSPLDTVWPSLWQVATHAPVARALAVAAALRAQGDPRDALRASVRQWWKSLGDALWDRAGETFGFGDRGRPMAAMQWPSPDAAQLARWLEGWTTAAAAGLRMSITRHGTADLAETIDLSAVPPCFGARWPAAWRGGALCEWLAHVMRATVPALSAQLEAAEPREVAGALQLLAAAGVRNRAVRSHLERFLGQATGPVLQAAMGAVGRLHACDLLAVVLRQATSSTSRRTQTQALRALAACRPEAGTRIHARAADFVRDGLRSRWGTVRLAALAAAGALRDPALVGAVAQLTTAAHPRGERLTAVDALAHIGSENAIAALRAVARAGAPLVAARARTALTRLDASAPSGEERER